MKYSVNGRKLLLSSIIIIVASFIIHQQFQITRAGSLEGDAEGKDWRLDYFLLKESRGEWLMDLNFISSGSGKAEIYETRVVFADPIGHDIFTIVRGSDEGHRLEGHVLTNTNKFSEKEITKVLNRSYVLVKGLDDTGKPAEEKIYLK